MEKDCIFCKIFSGEIPTQKIYQRDNVIGFRDINPLAPIHLLFIHKEHSRDFCELYNAHPQGLMEIFQAISQYSQISGLDKSGFRIVTNIGRSSGQSIYHTHFHVLSSEKLGKFGD